MNNHRLTAGGENAIRRGAMQRYCNGGTGGSIVAADAPTASMLASRLWGLVNTETLREQSRSATTGSDLFYMLLTTESDVFYSMPVVVRIGSGETESASEPGLTPIQSEAAVSLASAMDSVREVFGLNVSEAAAVLKVTRQTVYQWMKLDDMQQIRAREDRDRLKMLYQAALRWQSLPKLKGRWLHALLPAGNTVLDLLMAAEVNENVLLEAHAALSLSTAKRRQEEGERTGKAIDALADAFGGLGAGRRSVRKDVP